MQKKNIEKYLRGDASASERVKIWKWVEANEDNRKEFMAFRNVYDALLMSDTLDVESEVRKPSHAVRKGAIAAASLLAACLTVFLVVHMNPSGTAQDESGVVAVNTIAAPLGHQSQTVLSDGTTVWLNSGSELSVTNFSGSERRVSLSGEAFFDVAHDGDRPFIVESDGLEVHVCGTRFNVNTYTDRKSVVLVSGSVDVSHDGQTSTIAPGQLYLYDRTSGVEEIRDVDTGNYVSWTRGYLQFEKAPLSLVFSQLGSYFGVEFDYDTASLGSRTLTGKFVLSEGVEFALDNLSFLVPISYKVGTGNTIHITVRQK